MVLRSRRNPCPGPARARHWYRLGAVDVRSALAHPATLAAPEAATVARSLAGAEEARREAAFRRRRGRLGSRARTEKELAYQRRRQRERAHKQKRAARLLAISVLKSKSRQVSTCG